MNENSKLYQLLRVIPYVLLSFFFLFTIHVYAMLGEGSFVGTGGYAIGGTPYYYAGLSYYYNPEMDYFWDGQQWIFKTGAQWPPRCCKPNPCSSCGYRRISRCDQLCPSTTLEECIKLYKNNNSEG